jgi:hypothetical protein
VFSCNTRQYPLLVKKVSEFKGMGDFELPLCAMHYLPCDDGRRGCAKKGQRPTEEMRLTKRMRKQCFRVAREHTLTLLKKCLRSLSDTDFNIVISLLEQNGYLHGGFSSTESAVFYVLSDALLYAGRGDRAFEIAKAVLNDNLDFLRSLHDESN